jgi:hypothetical protein
MIRFSRNTTIVLSLILAAAPVVAASTKERILLTRVPTRAIWS